MERMLSLQKIAVTGGLSSGKSSVCRFFKELGAYVVSADEIVHQLLSSETGIIRQVINLLGNDIAEEGSIDRSRVAEKVFNNARLLQALEDILHPAVREKTFAHYRQAIAAQAPLFVAEVPLLFETGSEKDYDYTICVTADSEISLKRFQSSKGYGNEEYQSRMARQLSPRDKCAKADFIIHNNGSLTDLKQAVSDIYHQLNPTI